MTASSSPENSQQFPWLAHYPPGISWNADIPVSSVPEVLAETVRQHGALPAINFMGRRWNWAEIGAQVDQMAKGLQGLGVRKGTRVGLFLPNCTYFIMAYYAVLKAGGTVVNFNPLYAPENWCIRSRIARPKSW